MNKSELKPQYSIFGNKGNVWSNACHIARGSEPTTLCGVPMLSSNWARIEDVQTIGCPECLAIYAEQNKPAGATKSTDMDKLVAEYSFENVSQYYDMITESYINGQRKQCKAQFLAMPKDFKKDYINQLDEYSSEFAKGITTFITGVLVDEHLDK